MLYAAGMIPGDFVKKYNHRSGSYSHDGVFYPLFKPYQCSTTTTLLLLLPTVLLLY
jgi:hypothetical protein